MLEALPDPPGSAGVRLQIPKSKEVRLLLIINEDREFSITQKF
jgi:hypothetical protein